MNDWIGTDEQEQPLGRLCDGGGYVGIFRTLAVVGDSLSSGEFEGRKNGQATFHDLYDYSWGAFLGRMAGTQVHLFARGGMTAKEYVDTFAEERGFWDGKYAAQGYLIALGVNDLYNQNREIGSVADIAEDPSENGDTFLGDYAKIVQRYREISSNAKFFFVTMPREEPQDARKKELGDAHRKALYDLAAYFPNCYVIDLRTYGPVYDEAFRKKFFLFGHMAPMGYLLTAKLICSYMDFLIRRHPADFKALGGVRTEFEDELFEEKNG